MKKCAKQKKKCFRSERAAWIHIAHNYEDLRARAVYVCEECGYYHMTSLRDETPQWVKDKVRSLKKLKEAKQNS